MSPKDVFEQESSGFSLLTAPERVGNRIRKIRSGKGLSQSELGERVGLTADRIQKYENGVRKPKPELLKKIAEALDVDTLALTDPIVSNHLGAMYALFEMEDLYALKVRRINDRIALTFGDGISGLLNSYLAEWEKKCRQIELELKSAPTEECRASVLKEYMFWEWTFPQALLKNMGRESNALRRKQIQEQIYQLQQELNALNKD